MVYKACFLVWLVIFDLSIFWLLDLEYLLPNYCYIQSILALESLTFSSNCSPQEQSAIFMS